MAKRRIPAETGDAAVASVREHGVDSDRAATGLAVRYLLQSLADRSPGNTLEVRVPPYGAVQCLEGPTHTRGTPPNVIETDAATWIALATGELPWSLAVSQARVQASGQRADLAALLPINPARGQ